MARLTRIAIERALLTGTPIKWRDGNAKEHRFALETPEQRRLFGLLLKSRVREAKGLPPDFVTALLQAYTGEEDPALEPADTGESVVSSGPWRLRRIAATGFGGLNLWAGKEFIFDFKQDSLLIEGPNGSGKSSLIGAIIWGLTGERPRDYSDARAHELQTVYSEDDKRAGTWPPIACYPNTTEDLKNTLPRVSVELTFETPEGSVASLTRTLEGATLQFIQDPRLEIPTILLETGILMPARLAQIRFKEGQGKLTDAVKKLTGLDTLSDVGALVEGLCHRGREYLSYARSQNVPKMREDFEALLDDARTALEPVSVNVSAFSPNATQDPESSMAKLGKELSARASHFTKIIADDLIPGLDLNDNKIQKAIALAIHLLRENILRGLGAIPTWQTLTSITDALDGDAGHQLSAAVSTARRNLASALDLHEKSKSDSRLRLKANAAQWHATTKSGPIVICPLCDQSLEACKSLADELETLKTADEATGRSLRDNIHAATTTLDDSLPQVVKAKIFQHRKINAP